MRLEAEVREPPPDQPRFADETGVEQHGAVVAHQQMADAHDAADGINAGIAHCAKFAGLARDYGYPNALNVMIVRVSWMPGMICTFSFTKWPISVESST